MKCISDQDHEHAQQLSSTMEKIDLLLLADVFEIFWNTWFKNYKLDLAHFYPTPGLAWCALLKTTTECEHEKIPKGCELCPDEFRLQLLTDIDILLMVERVIRGGITQTVKRYTKANNKYMDDLYNHDEKSIYLQYLDANNLHGCSMVQKLPTHGFLWKETEDFTSEDIDEIVKKRQEAISIRGRCGVS